MANVVRLVNGGSIQVRTGVLQGIGPQGQRGVQGEQGQQGERGVQGDPGPIGQILALGAKTSILANNPLAANTDALVTFGSVSYDDLSCFTTSTNCTLGTAGDYLLSAWLRFDDAAATTREIWFMVGSSLIARSTRTGIAGAPFYLDLQYPYRAAANEVVQVYCRSGSATGVSLGQMNVNRVGSGPLGPQGPKGDPGLQGIQGIQGPAGPPGNANSGFTKYADMLPH